MSPLPVERELPPARHAELRAALLDQIAEPSAPGRSRLVPIAAAAAAVALLGGAAVAVGSLRPEPEPTVPAASPPAPPTSQVPRPTILGLAPSEAEAILEGCARSFWGSAIDGPIPPAPPSTAPPAGANRLALYNMLADGAGKTALLYGGGSVMLTCEVDGPGMKYNAGGGAINAQCPPSCTRDDPPQRVDVLYGPFAVDSMSSSSGGDIAGNRDIYRGQPGYHLVVGRVRADVARVTVTLDGETLEAKVHNGTFMARRLYPSTWQSPDNPPRPLVHAYDAEGRELPPDATPHSWP